jgi:hypothetical protein
MKAKETFLMAARLLFYIIIEKNFGDPLPYFIAGF